MIARLLIANRGEIACRIIRTAQRMGIATVAVYSDADARALHVGMADAHARIGPPDARESYLDADAVIAAAKEHGADAIHPGYGFLSESKSFADRCEREGIVFVGPSGKAIELAGSKIEAKRIAQAAGLPVIDGFAVGADDSPESTAEKAGRIGYPLLVKASAGGGGRGIRIVESSEGLAEALAQAARESEAGFGDASVFIEKALCSARHIEVQVIADPAGRVAVVGDRDCSLQRRRQKVVEESPAGNLSEGLRMAIHADASRFAAEIGYRNAGTVEFLLDADGTRHFLEMNARLQVEHPVTEMVHGVDLVEWQLRIAAGENLPGTFPPPPQGHAIEVRVCAEAPEQGFAPSRGVYARIDAPDAVDAPGRVRFDSGVAPGDHAVEHYDSLAAKLVVHHRDGRDACLAALRTALGRLRIEGVATNLAYLREASALPAFCEGRHTTELLAQETDAIVARCIKAADEAACMAVAGWLHRLEAETGLAGFRLNGSPRALVAVFDGIRSDEFSAERTGPGTLRVFSASGETKIDLPGMAASGEGRLGACVDGSHADVELRIDDVSGGWSVGVCYGGIWRSFALRSVLDGEGAAAAAAASDAGHVLAPMHGKLVAVNVEVGDEVARDQTLALLEAMKMEMPVKASASGTVAEIVRQAGDQVSMGDLLVRLDERPD